jgi:hypothetical protein
MMRYKIVSSVLYNLMRRKGPVECLRGAARPRGLEEAACFSCPKSHRLEQLVMKDHQRRLCGDAGMLGAGLLGHAGYVCWVRTFVATQQPTPPTTYHNHLVPAISTPPLLPDPLKLLGSLLVSQNNG